MQPTSLSRRPLFWVVLTGIFISGLTFSYYYFPKAFPIVSLDIKMNLTEALHNARTLARQYNWGPEHFEQAAAFYTDEETKNFIELEGGGKEQLTQIIKEKYYTPYTWTVRHFKEYETNETWIDFAPDGTKFGFNEKIPEKQPGPALTKEEAQHIAIKQASQEWNIDFSLYKEIEHAQETQPNGRIDHTFVYERLNKKVGDAHYRLQLGVTGNIFSNLKLFINVPEAFKRRYEQLRSANDTLANMANIIMLILYVIGGCFFGLLFLMRRRFIIWQPAFKWSFFIGLLSVLSDITQLPTLWMSYNTAYAKETFYFNLLTQFASSFAFTTIFYGLIFTAAEGLTRRIFPERLQFWRLWTYPALASWQTLGRTIGGFLTLGFDFSFLVTLYYFATRYLHWWLPASTLINPNILATYMPWLNAISESLGAGFMEECLFRAIPIAGATFIGQRWGNRTVGLTVGFVMQAIVFGAAHANYPALPAYARLVELIIPSFVFGGIYLLFGLLPGIIAHFAYDVFWFSLPIFLSNAGGMWLNQFLVIFFTLFPLMLVLFSRLYYGKFFDVSTTIQNKQWVAPVKEKQRKPLTPLKLQYFTMPLKNALIIAGSIGLILWLCTTRFTHDDLSFTINKTTAQQQAQLDVLQHDGKLKEPWRRFTITARTSPEQQHRYVWRTNKPLYYQLIGNYLGPTLWHTRYAQFEGDVVKRAEEYNVYVHPHGDIHRIIHTLPESQPGASLSKEKARDLAEQALKQHFNLELTNPDVKEVSAVSYQHPQRLDWTFTFQDVSAYSSTTDDESSGQARITIEIAGNEVADYYRYVFVPETWQRMDAHEQQLLSLFKNICSLLAMLIYVLGAIQTIRQWMRGIFNFRIFFIFFSVLATKSLIQILNTYETIIASFDTTKPFIHQWLNMMSTITWQSLAIGAMTAALAAFTINARFTVQRFSPWLERFMLGGSMGILIASYTSLMTRIIPALSPLWPSYSYLGAWSPTISMTAILFTNLIKDISFYYLIFYGADILTNNWQKNKILVALLFCFTGIASISGLNIEYISLSILTGIGLGLLFMFLYVYGIRFDRSMIPIIVGTIYCLSLLQEIAFAAFPGVIIGSLLSILVIIVTSSWWSYVLTKKEG